MTEKQFEKEWKPLAGYEGIYEISNTGEVKALARTAFNGVAMANFKEKLLKPVLLNIGYYEVTLYKDKNPTRAYVHRLVAQSFIPERAGATTVNHIDGNRLNNKVDNLEWVIQAENIRHAVSLGRMSARHNPKMVKKISGEQVDQIKVMLKQGYKQKIIAEKFGVSIPTISSIKTGARWSEPTLGGEYLQDLPKVSNE